jgi:putative ABC transport system permease protein
VNALVQDLRHSFRALGRSPGFTAATVATLALGIGANTAIFSAVHAVLLAPLPYRGADRLVMVEGNYLTLGMEKIGASVPEFLDERAGISSFEALAAFRSRDLNLTGGGEAERVPGASVSSDLFPLLGVSPARGRGFARAEEEAGRGSVAVVSDGFWRRHFAADPAAVGRTVTLNGTAYTIVGVMPPGFEFPHPAYPLAHRADIWLPLSFTAEERLHRSAYSLRVVARLRGGVSLARANAEAVALGRRWQRDLPDYRGPRGEDGGWKLSVVPLTREIAGPGARRSLFVLLAAVGLLLLIACANLANLNLARSLAREPETAIRLAVGASRWRIARLLLAESLTLALLGGAAGALLALRGVGWLASSHPSALPRLGEARADAVFFVFAFALSALTGLLFGLAPALRAARTDLARSMRRTGKVSGGLPGRRLLVASEVGLAVILLAGSGLLLRSFVRLAAVNPGFDPQHVLTAEIALPASRYDTDARRAEFFDRLTDRLRQLPGVTAAGAASLLPLSGPGFSGPFSVEGRPFDTANPSFAGYRAVTPGYFATLSMRLSAGRPLTRGDAAGQTPVVIVADTLARRFFPKGDSLGKRIKLGAPGSPRPWLTVVGVIADAPYAGLSIPARPEMYVPQVQSPVSAMSLVVRGTADPMDLAASVRAAVATIDPDQPVYDVRALERLVSDAVAAPRLSALLLALFAGLAVTLSAVGVYGVASYSAARRTREMGIRAALGAAPGDLIRLALSEGTRSAAIGLVAGLAAALVLARGLSGLLYGISPWDPATFSIAAAFLAGVCLLAAYVPARRAAFNDPMTALRTD